jgi:hypothetical protein
MREVWLAGVSMGLRFYTTLCTLLHKAHGFYGRQGRLGPTRTWCVVYYPGSALARRHHFPTTFTVALYSCAALRVFPNRPATWTRRQRLESPTDEGGILRKICNRREQYGRQVETTTRWGGWPSRLRVTKF